jgi:hypothetical protein
MQTMLGIQTGLFDELKQWFPLGDDDSTTIKWSHSRRDLFDKCQLAYYREYFGGNKKTAKSEPDKEHLHFLKSLQSRYENAGTILHRLIKTFLAKAQTGQVWSLDYLQKLACDSFRRDVEFSRLYPNSHLSADEKYPPTLLLEFYYKLPDAEKLCAEVEERMLSALANFYLSEQFDLFRRGAMQPGALLEEKVSYPGENATLTGQLDAAFKWEADGRVKVVDWKMGAANEPAGESLQLAFYALGATDKFKCEPEEIDVYRAHLGDAEVAHSTFSRKQLERAKARINQDIERMRLMEVYGQAGEAAAFEPCRQPRICAGCVFQGRCPVKEWSDDFGDEL